MYNDPKREKRDTAESILGPKSGPALAALPDRRRRPCKDLIRATYMTGPKSLNGYRGEIPFERYQTGSFSHIGW